MAAVADAGQDAVGVEFGVLIQRSGVGRVLRTEDMAAVSAVVATDY